MDASPASQRCSLADRGVDEDIALKVKYRLTTINAACNVLIKISNRKPITLQTFESFQILKGNLEYL